MINVTELLRSVLTGLLSLSVIILEKTWDDKMTHYFTLKEFWSRFYFRLHEKQTSLVNNYQMEGLFSISKFKVNWKILLKTSQKESRISGNFVNKVRISVNQDIKDKGNIVYFSLD